MMNAKDIAQTMMEGDLFSQWLGIEILEAEPGKVMLTMTAREEMVNGLGILHGGITYSLADTCLAFTANGRGRRAVSVETSISHTAPVSPGDKLTAVGSEEHLSNKIGVYRVEIVNAEGRGVALFKGTVYRTSKEW